MDRTRLISNDVFDGGNDEIDAAQRKNGRENRLGRRFFSKPNSQYSILEVTGAFEPLLPMLTGILPILTPLTAVGLVLTMMGAFKTHLRSKDIVPMGVTNIMLFMMAAFVAYGRF